MIWPNQGPEAGAAWVLLGPALFPRPRPQAPPKADPCWGVPCPLRCFVLMREKERCSPPPRTKEVCHGGVPPQIHTLNPLHSGQYCQVEPLGATGMG